MVSEVVVTTKNSKAKLKMTVVEATLKIKDLGAAKILKFGSLFRAFVFD